MEGEGAPRVQSCTHPCLRAPPLTCPPPPGCRQPAPRRLMAIQATRLAVLLHRPRRRRAPPAPRARRRGRTRRPARQRSRRPHQRAAAHSPPLPFTAEAQCRVGCVQGLLGGAAWPVGFSWPPEIGKHSRPRTRRGTMLGLHAGHPLETRKGWPLSQLQSVFGALCVVSWLVRRARRQPPSVLPRGRVAALALTPCACATCGCAPAHAPGRLRVAVIRPDAQRGPPLGAFAVPRRGVAPGRLCVPVADARRRRRVVGHAQ